MDIINLKHYKEMKKIIFSLVVILAVMIASNFSNAQDNGSNGKIKGVVLDKNTNTPMESAAVQLFDKDSNLVGGALTTTEGKFIIEDIKPGVYNLKISYIGYGTAYAKNVEVSSTKKELSIGTVKLEVNTEMTQEIEVVDEAPVMTMEAGKKVFDVKKDLTAQTGNALDMLKNIPSVDVDNDGNVSLRGAGNVKILINGKPSAMLSNGTQFLQSIPANMIDKVEVINNPSSKYEAEGISGIINLIMKENSSIGYNGNIKANGGTGDKYNISGNMNYKKGALSLTGNYSFWSYQIPGTMTSNRKLLDNDVKNVLQQNTRWKYKGVSHYGSFGADYDINEKNTLSVNLSTIFFNRNRDIKSLSDFYNSGGVMTDKLNTNNIDITDGYNVDATVTYTKKFEEKGNELTASVNFSGRKEDGDMNYAEDDLINPTDFQKRVTGYRYDFLNSQIDYVYQISENSKFETGLKNNTRFIKGDAFYSEYDKNTNTWQPMTMRNNNVDYFDNIGAGYVNYSGKYKNFSYQVGLRGEFTNSKLTLLQETGEYKQNYFDIFPSASLSQKIGLENQLTATYSRRINRPNLWFLNPFKDYSDPNNIRSGNVYLKPEYINSFELGFTRYLPFATLTLTSYYRNVNDIINFIVTVDGNGVSYLRPENLGNSNTYGLEFIAQGGFAKWWTYNGSVSYYSTNTYGSSVLADFDKTFYAWSGRFNTNVMLADIADISFTYFYNGKNVTAQGTIEPFQMMNIAVQKNLFEKRLVLGLRVNDLLNQQAHKLYWAGTNYEANLYGKPSSRSLFLTLTYNFGDTGMKTSRVQQRKQREMEGEIQQTGN